MSNFHGGPWSSKHVKTIPISMKAPKPNSKQQQRYLFPVNSEISTNKKCEITCALISASRFEIGFNPRVCIFPKSRSNKNWSWRSANRASTKKLSCFRVSGESMWWRSISSTLNVRRYITNINMKELLAMSTKEPFGIITSQWSIYQSGLQIAYTGSSESGSCSG